VGFRDLAATQPGMGREHAVVAASSAESKADHSPFSSTKIGGTHQKRSLQEDAV
jgi:hypothetical protein